MIAQLVACRYPARVVSLTSIMSSTGSRVTGQPAPAVLPLFLSRAARTKEAYAERAVALFRAVGSREELFDEERVRESAERSWKRGISISGTGRQMAAIIADRNRTSRLKRITAPTLVIHGTVDRLIRPSGGKATARAIPGAKLLLIDGMGHDLPRGAWPQIVDAIADNAARAQAGERTWQAA
jgi:pimeloyl-ACP methyl ester carboxylesterase